MNLSPIPPVTKAYTDPLPLLDFEYLGEIASASVIRGVSRISRAPGSALADIELLRRLPTTVQLELLHVSSDFCCIGSKILLVDDALLRNDKCHHAA